MKNTMKKGYTLTEMLIYIAIFSLILVTLISSLVFIVKAHADMKVKRNVVQAATVSLERMTREIRNASSVDVQSILSSHPGRLVLNGTDDNQNPYTREFYFASSSLYMKENTLESGRLFPAGVIINELVFRHITASTSKAIKIEMTLQAGSATSSTIVKKFYSTTVMRGSY